MGNLTNLRYCTFIPRSPLLPTLERSLLEAENRRHSGAMQPRFETSLVKLRIIHNYQTTEVTGCHLNISEDIRRSRMQSLITFGEGKRSN